MFLLPITIVDIFACNRLLIIDGALLENLSIYYFSEFYIEFKSKSDIEIHHPIDHNIKKKDLSEYRKEVEGWNSINKQPLSKTLKKSNSEADILKIIPTSSLLNSSLYSKAINNR